MTMALMIPMNPPVWMKYMALLANGVIGFIVFKEARSFLLKVSTAFIGSFIFIYGLSMVVARNSSSNLQF